MAKSMEMSTVGVAEALWEGAGARWAEQKNFNGRGHRAVGVVQATQAGPIGGATARWAWPKQNRPVYGRSYGAVGVASAGPGGEALGLERPRSLESESARKLLAGLPGVGREAGGGPGGLFLLRAWLAEGESVPEPLPGRRQETKPGRPRAPPRARPEICAAAGDPGDPRTSWGWQCGVQLPGQRWGPSPPLLSLHARGAEACLRPAPPGDPGTVPRFPHLQNGAS